MFAHIVPAALHMAEAAGLFQLLPHTDRQRLNRPTVIMQQMSTAGHCHTFERNTLMRPPFSGEAPLQIASRVH